MNGADFLLVIPAFREQRRLPPFLTDLVEALADAPFTTVIRIVDDGSPESECKQLRAAVHPGVYGHCRILPLVVLPFHQGKGAAILNGWRHPHETRGMAFVDADGSISASEVVRLLRLARTKFERGKASCLFAARLPGQGRCLKRTFFRYWSGKLFAWLVATLLDSGMRDPQCGFKMVPREWFERIDLRLKETGLCFDLELLLALRQVGAPIEEVAIDWERKDGGRVSVWRNGWTMVKRVWALRERERQWREEM